MKRFQLTFIACSLALSGTAWAATNADSSYLQRVTPRYQSFAGSGDNLSSLASGLRSGNQITLTGSGEKAVFVPPTKPMGYGNVTRSLDLAQRQLAAQGITNPTPSQLQAALTGGTITTPKGTVTYGGVLKMRSDGMGWGKIAHSVGVHPGMGKSNAAVAPKRASATNASGRSVIAHSNDKPASARASGNGNGHARIATPSGNSGNSAASAHASARGLAGGGGHGNAGGNHGNAGGGGQGNTGGGHGNSGGGGGGGRGK